MIEVLILTVILCVSQSLLGRISVEDGVSPPLPAVQLSKPQPVAEKVSTTNESDSGT